LNQLGIVPYYVGATYTARGLTQALENSNFTTLDVTSFWHFPRFFAFIMLKIVNNHCSAKFKFKLLQVILAFEQLSRLPTRFLTGHFIAARAVKNL